jgi:hypothetical protein
MCAATGRANGGTDPSHSRRLFEIPSQIGRIGTPGRAF